MFIRDLDDADIEKSKECVMLGLEFKSIFKDNENYKWGKLRDLPEQKMYEIMQTGVFPFIKTLHDDKDSSYSTYKEKIFFNAEKKAHY